MPDANLTKSVMHFFDCFMDDFYDENYIQTLSDLDVRSQIEVIFFLFILAHVEACIMKVVRILFLPIIVYPIIGLLLIFVYLGDGRNADGKLSRMVQHTF